MRYLVHRGTGTILGVNDDLVIVDIDDDDLDEGDILEIADKATWKDKPLIGTYYELPIFISDTAIATELNDYVSNWDYIDNETDVHSYCLNNPDTWSLIRDYIIEDNSLWNEYSETFAMAVQTVANDHQAKGGVAE